jgi:hypothetical protein
MNIMFGSISPMSWIIATRTRKQAPLAQKVLNGAVVASSRQSWTPTGKAESEPA